MRFKVKDLIISVMPPGLGAGECGDCTGRCSNADTDCPGGCSNNDTNFHTDGCIDWLVDPADLVEMRALLESAVARLDAGRKQPRLSPRTIEEAEALEAKLESALKQVRALKQQLAKKK